MDFLNIIVKIMDFINVTINDIFFFVPASLQIFALTIIIIDVCEILERSKKKINHVSRYIVMIIFFLYTILRLLPWDSMVSIEYTNPVDVISGIFSALPYISMILIILKVRYNRYIKALMTSETMHIVFLLLSIIMNYITPGSVDLFWTITFALGMYITGNFVYLAKKKYE